jgi:small subunit ribosomal protein S4e
MSSKGEKKKVKALNASKTVQISRKENTWTVNTRAGAYKSRDSVALGIILRNYIKIARNMSEAKMLLRDREIKVNGIIRKDYRLAVGLFDIISIEKQEKNYRMIFDKKRRLQAVEIEKGQNEKISKIIFKKTTKKGIQITTNDGRVYVNQKANTNDSLKIKLPEGKIEKVFEMKEGNLAYITKGTHCSKKGIIKEIQKGTAKREKLVRLEIEGKEIETIMKNIIIIGEKEEAIKDLKKI